MRTTFKVLITIFLLGCIVSPVIFTGLLIGYLTDSVLVGIFAGLLAYVPTHWVWTTTLREQRELDAYYASLK